MGPSWGHTRGKGPNQMELHKVNYAALPLVTVAMKDVSIQPGAYCMSFGYDETGLTRSIGKVGMINPPCLVQKDTGSFEVVTGYRRLLAARSLGWDNILCRNLTDLEMAGLDLLLLNFYENLSSRPFNEIEKAMVLKRFSSHVSREPLIKEYLPLLGLTPHETNLETYLRFNDLDESMKKALAMGKLSGAAASLLLDQAPDPRMAMFEWIMKLRLNFNYQSQFIDILVELSCIMDLGVEDILSMEPVTQVLLNEETNIPQKAKSLLATLRGLRNPRVAEAEHRFREQLALVHLPPGSRIIHSPFFENAFFTLEIPFKDGKELKEKTLRISKSEGIEAIQAPWRKRRET